MTTLVNFEHVKIQTYSLSPQHRSLVPGRCDTLQAAEACWRTEFRSPREFPYWIQGCTGCPRVQKIPCLSPRCHVSIFASHYTPAWYEKSFMAKVNSLWCNSERLQAEHRPYPGHWGQKANESLGVLAYPGIQEAHIDVVSDTPKALSLKWLLMVDFSVQVHPAESRDRENTSH